MKTIPTLILIFFSFLNIGIAQTPDYIKKYITEKNDLEEQLENYELEGFTTDVERRARLKLEERIEKLKWAIKTEKERLAWKGPAIEFLTKKNREIIEHFGSRDSIEVFREFLEDKIYYFSGYAFMNGGKIELYAFQPYTYDKGRRFRASRYYGKMENDTLLMNGVISLPRRQAFREHDFSKLADIAAMEQINTGMKFSPENPYTSNIDAEVASQYFIEEWKIHYVTISGKLKRNINIIASDQLELHDWALEKQN